MAHSRWTEVEGRAAVAAWRKSGLRASEFARRQGINVQRLHWWRKRLPEEEAVELVPVELDEVRRGEPVLVMLRSGHMLKVGRNFDEEAFARVVAVLEQC